MPVSQPALGKLNIFDSPVAGYTTILGTLSDLAEGLFFMSGCGMMPGFDVES
jgi:hypothetical protein